MPELPDLQVFRSNLQKRFVGKTLQMFTVHNPKKLNTSEEKCKQALEGQWLKSVKRHGKELFFEFNNKEVIGVHLMLKGQFVELPHYQPTNLILALHFDGGKGLAITDSMSLTRITLNPPSPQAPDALDLEFNIKYLLNTLHKNTKVPVKSFLMDQKIVRGIGNAYVDEILWEAKISPFSHCDQIPESAVRELHRHIKQVLKNGETQIKISHPDIIAGEIRDFMKIHHPDKTHSPTGADILIQKLNKRKTYYTKEQVTYITEQSPTVAQNTQRTGKKSKGVTTANKQSILDDLPF
ncbi:DNA-formamidopyrimidine glycosylase family protein [Microscilla marina]|uniref:Formamidopyrimidine-DNA glycosylase (Fapy-DNAglycosylase) (DNA-(Apurinic or apyrimidinic site) lyase MutM), putative n=1 Tax=Microscilla marina ATCC 23134 TaxID=313606 RepID=A1ZGX6_MICM2|nr:DNA-formamidopyrimidine glycosylase family protein [Microscilla marina]EAY30245.1 formamidopyrimidine-DNA glycosylase (Fapy-DNAglycosylase) (DNA-(apurinic or apyrimidinic site) lyase MutM), putative [Microscilla marina ATCC 23134]